MFALPKISIGEPTFFPQIRALEDDVKDISWKIGDFTEPLKISLETVVLPSIATNFAAQGRPRWKPLAVSTVFARRGRTGPILQRSGKLKGSATSKENWLVSKDLLMIDYTAIPLYGAYHQLGTKRMPARPFVLYQPEDIEAIVQIFDAWLTAITGEEWST